MNLIGDNDPASVQTKLKGAIHDALTELSKEGEEPDE
jgi:hypothetical protein